MKLSLESLETRETPSTAGPVVDDPVNLPAPPPVTPPSEPAPQPTW